MSDFTFCGKGLANFKFLDSLYNSSSPLEVLLKYLLKLKLTGGVDNLEDLNICMESMDNWDFYTVNFYNQYMSGYEGFALVSNKSLLMFRILEKDGIRYLRIDCSNKDTVIKFNDNEFVLGNNCIITNPCKCEEVYLVVGLGLCTASDCIVDNQNGCIKHLDKDTCQLDENYQLRKSLNYDYRNDEKCELCDFTVSCKSFSKSGKKLISKEFNLYYDDNGMVEAIVSPSEVKFSLVPKE